MRSPFLLFCFLSVLYDAPAQPGFNKTVLFPDARSCIISGVTTDQDTIICFGTLFGIAEQKWGVYLAKFDSLGNFLQITTDFDSVYQQTVDPLSQVICTADGGYMGVSAQGVGYKSAAYKFSHEGKLEWKQVYRETDMQVIVIISAVETESGFLLFGRYAVNYDNSHFCMKISKTGDLVWFSKTIGVWGNNDYALGRAIKIDNRFIVGTNLDAINSSLTYPAYWSKSRIVEVDTLGNVQWEWHSEVSENEYGIYSLVASGDSAVIYTTTQYYPNAFNGHDFQLILRKVDTQTSATVWRKTLTPVNLTDNSGWFHLLPSPDGSGFDAVGVRQDKDIGFIISGWAAHMDWEGEIVWQRYDTVYVDTSLWVNENKLFNLAHLSSGSIVGVGYVRSATPYGHNEGWLIKWSANGCLSPDDCATVSTHDDLSGDMDKRLDGWDLFPNPARGHTWLYQPDDAKTRNVVLLVTDMSGRAVLNLEYPHNSDGQYEVPLDGLLPGLYFYQVLLDESPGQAGRLVVF